MNLLISQSITLKYCREQQATGLKDSILENSFSNGNPVTWGHNTCHLEIKSCCHFQRSQDRYLLFSDKNFVSTTFLPSVKIKKVPGWGYVGHLGGISQLLSGFELLYCSRKVWQHCRSYSKRGTLRERWEKKVFADSIHKYALGK